MKIAVAIVFAALVAFLVFAMSQWLQLVSNEIVKI